MTSDEYRAALEALGLSQVEGSAVLGSDERTSRRWASGERSVPPSVAKLLRLMIAMEIEPSVVKAL